MSDQELKFFQELQDEDTICRSMHHHFTASSHHHRPTTASKSPDKYTTTAYINSTKRQSPLSPSSFQEPLPKRATLHFPSSSSTTAAAAATSDAAPNDYHLCGFTRLPLPHPFPAVASPPPPRRTLSEPVHSADVINPSAPPPQSSEFQISPNPVLNQPLQENPNRNIILQDSYPVPNAAPVIHRTISDPSPVANFQAVPGGTPPRRPPLARNVLRSPSCGESPSTKRLRRMKERLREMSQWWNEVVREGEEEDNEYENYCSDNIHKEEPENEMENPSQEAVWVEKNGECLVLHFKCSCGTVYQILLSGNNCYYKLTNF